MVLLAREFGWTLDEMRALYPSELYGLLQELQRQLLLEEYNEQLNKWSYLVASVYNGFTTIARMLSRKKGRCKVFEPKDFISKDFHTIVKSLLPETEEKDDYENHMQDVKKKGLRGPLELQ